MHLKRCSHTNHQKMQIETTVRYTSYLSEWPSSKGTQITSIGKDVEQRAPSPTLLVGLCTGAARGERESRSLGLIGTDYWI